MCLFNSPNTATSSGWVWWDEWGGRISKVISWSIQNSIQSPVMWLSCPSQINIRNFPLAFSWVTGSKQCSNHFKPYWLLVQPLVLYENAQVSWTLSGTQSSNTFLALRIVKCGMKVPSAQIHTIDVTHSWRLHFTWNFYRILALIITFDTSISLMANPLSSML